MQQLATNLVFLLEKQALQAVQTDLLGRQGRLGGSGVEASTENELANIKLDDLAISILLHMNPLPLEKRSLDLMYTHTNAFYVQILAIAAAFNAVDVDNRGVISFTDFTNFCLRVGRMILKPSVKYVMKNYLLSQDTKSVLYPSDKMRYISSSNLLLVFDSDAPRVRVYSKDMFLTRVNPVLAAKKALHTSVAAKLTYYEKMQLEKQATQLRITERELDESRGVVLDACYADSVKQYVFTTLHSYLIFIDGAAGLYDDKGEMRIIGHAKTSYPMHTLQYSKVLDLVIAIPGEGSDHVLQLFDPHTRKMKFKIAKHDAKVLSLCEVILDKIHPLKDHYFASSSMDGKLILWPTAPLSTMMNKLHTQRMLRVAETVDYDLKGHHHAIHSLVYASQQEIIIGAGYDFEILAWDPFTRDMCMKFAGHFKSIAGIQMVYIPDERLMSVDETGMIKLWNVSKELGIYGTQEHSFQLHCQQPAHIRSFSRTYGDGKGIAILAEKLYFLNLESDYADDLKPLLFGVCPTLGRLFTVCRSSFQMIDIISSRVAKSLVFLDPDRVSSTDQIISRSDELRMQGGGDQEGGAKGLKIGTKSAGKIDIKDTVTACAMDSLGKKVFIGTLEGRVLMFDSFTFGLLKQLTDEDEDDGFRYQGAVAALQYVDRDELLVVVYGAGAVKIFGGSLRHAYAGPKHSLNKPQHSKNSSKTGGMEVAKTSLDKEDFIPHANGGKPPTRPFLIRECDLGILPDYSVRALAVSEVYNLIAVLTKQGVIYFYDYLNLTFLVCVALEDEIEGNANNTRTAAQNDTVKQYVSIKFLPYLPIVVIADSSNTVFTWSVRPMSFKHLLTWNIYTDIKYESSLRECFPNIDLHDTVELPMRIEKATPISSTAVTSMRCFLFNTNTKEGQRMALSKKWLLLFGTDFGQMITLNVTELVQRSGAMEYIPRADAFYLAYHKTKPRRYFDPNIGFNNTPVPRIRIPEDLMPKLIPIRKEEDSPPPLPSEPVKTSTLAKLSRQQTRKIKKDTKKSRMEGKLEEFVQGLCVWQAFFQTAVKDWEYYDPYYDHSSNKSSRSYNQSYVPDCGAAPDRLPLLFIVSDQGHIRCMSFTGTHLGDALEEIPQSNFHKPTGKQALKSSTPASKKTDISASNLDDEKKGGQSEGKNAENNNEMCSTFITSVISEARLDGSFNNEEDADTASIEPSITIYVKNEKKHNLQARKVSIQPKSAFFFPNRMANKTSASSVSAVPNSKGNRKNVEFQSNVPLSPLLEEPNVENMQLNYSYPDTINAVGVTVTYANYTNSSHFAQKFLWTLPMVSVYLPFPSESKDSKEVLSVSTVTSLTYTQYTYYKDVLSRLLPSIEAEVNARFRARFESFSGEPDTHYAPKPSYSKQQSTYFSRFASSENLLQGLNSFLIDKKSTEMKHGEPHSPPASGITTLHKQNMTRESILEKIILTMSDREIMIAEIVKEQNKKKWERKSLTHLIDYIQSSDSFGDETKRNTAHGLTFKNYEKEKSRGKRAPWEPHSERSSLNYVELKREYFPELQKKKPQSEPSLFQSPNKSDLRLSVQIREVDLASSASISKDMTPMKDYEPITPIQREPFTYTHSIDSTEEILQHSLENVAHAFSHDPKEISKDPLDKMNPMQVLPRPKTAPSRSSERPKSRLFSPSTQQLRPVSSQASLRPFPLVSSPISPELAKSQSARTLRHLNQVNNLIDQLEDVTMDNSSRTKKKVVMKDREEFANLRPQTAHGRIESQTNEIEHAEEEEIMINGASTIRAFSANKERVEEIHQKFDDVILTLKSTVNSYQHYDPLRQKGMMELAKHKRKQQLRLKAALEGNNYVEDERFEGITDMEKEAKKQESKYLLAQARATGRKNGYGLYKYLDLVKFIHFLNLLHELGVPIHERNAIYFYDEVGTDISKYVREQPYYMVNEVLHYITILFGQSEHVEVLKESLLFHRDEVPKSQRISLFQLIGNIFVMSKAWGVQLRIYMFVTAAHMIYRLMRGALPPSDQREEHRKHVGRHSDSSFVGSDGTNDVEDNKLGLELASPVGIPSKVKSHLYKAITEHRQNSFTNLSELEEDSQVIEELSTTEEPNIALPSPARTLEHADTEQKDAKEGDKKEEKAERTNASKVYGNASMNNTVSDRKESFTGNIPEEKLLVNHLFFQDIVEETVLKYVVKPHPMRGFRQWIVKKKAFSAVQWVLNFWCDGSMECLTLTDLIEIMHSMVPRAHQEKYRIMRILPVAVNRLGLAGSQELSGQVLAKIFHTALEMKVVSD